MRKNTLLQRVPLAIMWMVALDAGISTAQPKDRAAKCSGAAQMLFQEDFESYAHDAELWARGGPYLNQWRKTVPPGGNVQLLRGRFRKSGRTAVELVQAGDTDSPYSNAVLYYRVPISVVEPHAKIGISGWISFENIADARLFFLNELWTGRRKPTQEHYGHREALLAGGIQYHSRIRKWQWEHGGGKYPYTSFSDPIEYRQGLDHFHFFKLVVDYKQGRYESFQFDDKSWDLTRHRLMVFEPDIAHDPTPAMFELNVRLITYDDYDRSYRCRAIVDDLAVFISLCVDG